MLDDLTSIICYVLPRGSHTWCRFVKCCRLLSKKSLMTWIWWELVIPSRFISLKKTNFLILAGCVFCQKIIRAVRYSGPSQLRLPSWNGLNIEVDSILNYFSMTNIFHAKIGEFNTLKHVIGLRRQDQFPDFVAFSKVRQHYWHHPYLLQLIDLWPDKRSWFWGF